MAEIRCPNCDTMLTVEMAEWWSARGKRRAVCPVCGWKDSERFEHSIHAPKLKLIRLSGDENMPETLNIREDITQGEKKRKKVL